jgi:signal transduction histidine kinase
MVSATHIAEEVVVTVADTGPGITPEELPRLFDKYRTAKQSGSQQGTGLGLFIAKTIVEAHGGRIEVKSAPGQGACFYVFLPLAFLPARATL